MKFGKDSFFLPEDPVFPLSAGEKWKREEEEEEGRVGGNHPKRPRVREKKFVQSKPSSFFPLPPSFP